MSAALRNQMAWCSSSSSSGRQVCQGTLLKQAWLPYFPLHNTSDVQPAAIAAFANNMKVWRNI
jgi:hypothetical protein